MHERQLKQQQSKREEMIEEIKKRKEDRERQHLEWITQMKELKNKEPLYMKIQKTYEEDVVLPSIKKEHQLISDLKVQKGHRIDLKEIHLHQLKHREHLSLLDLSKPKRSQSPTDRYDVEQLQNNMSYKRAIEEELLRKKLIEDKHHQQEWQQQKKNSYSKYVSICHAPVISPRKH